MYVRNKNESYKEISFVLLLTASHFQSHARFTINLRVDATVPNSDVREWWYHRIVLRNYEMASEKKTKSFFVCPLFCKLWNKNGSRTVEASRSRDHGS